MNIVVAGAGTVGVQVALALLANESMVVLIDVDPGRASTVAARGLTVVTGDAGVSTTLEEAGGLRADVLVACTGQDAENLMISLLARGDLVVAVIRHGRSTPAAQEGPCGPETGYSSSPTPTAWTGYTVRSTQTIPRTRLARRPPPRAARMSPTVPMARERQEATGTADAADRTARQLPWNEHGTLPPAASRVPAPPASSAATSVTICAVWPYSAPSRPGRL